MKGYVWILGAAVVTNLGGAAMADTIVPGDPSVKYAANIDSGFYVNSSGLSLYGATSYADTFGTPKFSLDAGALPGSYADAGIVLYSNGSLTLGQLQDVKLTMVGSNVTPTVNLWLDTGGDNQFFAYAPDASTGADKLTGLAGDSYFGAATPGDINGSTSFGYLGGPGGYGTYTLSQLQAGARAGIDANTKVGLWIGITGGDYYNANYAVMSKVDVGVGSAAAAVPLPAAAWMGVSLLGLGGVRGIKNRIRRHNA